MIFEPLSQVNLIFDQIRSKLDSGFSKAPTIATYIYSKMSYTQLLNRIKS